MSNIQHNSKEQDVPDGLRKELSWRHGHIKIHLTSIKYTTQLCHLPSNIVTGLDFVLHCFNLPAIWRIFSILRLLIIQSVNHYKFLTELSYLFGIRKLGFERLASPAPRLVYYQHERFVVRFSLIQTTLQIYSDTIQARSYQTDKASFLNYSTFIFISCGNAQLIAFWLVKNQTNLEMR